VGGGKTANYGEKKKRTKKILEYQNHSSSIWGKGAHSGGRKNLRLRGKQTNKRKKKETFWPVLPKKKKPLGKFHTKKKKHVSGKTPTRGKKNRNFGNSSAINTKRGKRNWAKGGDKKVTLDAERVYFEKIPKPAATRKRLKGEEKWGWALPKKVTQPLPLGEEH